MVIRSGRVLVLNRMPVVHGGRTIGSVTTLRDRTQLADLESEIGAFRGTTDLLRAQTHEFANQLHTISGLIQIGDYDEVVGYVDTLTEGRAALDLTVARRVRDRPVAALLVAKSAVAAERQVSLRVSAADPPRSARAVCSFDVATVLGNLVQNAIDAAASVPHREGGAWVQVEIHQSGSTVELDRQRQRTRCRRHHRHRGLRARLHDQGRPGRRTRHRPGADPADLPAARR